MVVGWRCVHIYGNISKDDDGSCYVLTWPQWKQVAWKSKSKEVRGNTLGKAEVFPMISLWNIEQMGPQSTYTVYLEYHSVCPLVGIGTPHSLFCKRVCPPPLNQRGVTIACGWGGGGVPIGWQKKKPSIFAYSVDGTDLDFSFSVSS